MTARQVLLLGTAAIVATGLWGASPAFGQAPREDVFWARNASGPITLDGVLDEPSWALAETKIIEYGKSAGIPGSGWKVEAGAFIPTDSTYATLKLLVYENKMYLVTISSGMWNFSGLLPGRRKQTARRNRSLRRCCPCETSDDSAFGWGTVARKSRSSSSKSNVSK